MIYANEKKCPDCGWFSDNRGPQHARGCTPIDPPQPEAATQGAGTMAKAVKGVASGVGNTISGAALSIGTVPGWAQVVIDRAAEMTQAKQEAQAAAAQREAWFVACTITRRHMAGLEPEPKPAGCPVCGGPILTARRVTHRDETVLCGMRCHDKYDLEFYGVDRRPEPAPDPLPTADEIARAIFETDPRVIGFVEHVAETTRPPVPPPYTTENHVAWQKHRGRMDGGFDIAWTRDEHGWATEAQARAEAMLDALNRRRT